METIVCLIIQEKSADLASQINRQVTHMRISISK